MTVELSIGKSIYKINCEESEKEKIVRLSARVNQRVNELALDFKNCDEKTLLVIAALTIEEELETAEKKAPSDDDTYEEQKFNEQDVYDAVSDTMENVTDYVEKMIKKIQNY